MRKSEAKPPLKVTIGGYPVQKLTEPLFSTTCPLLKTPLADKPDTSSHISHQQLQGLCVLFVWGRVVLSSEGAYIFNNVRILFRGELGLDNSLSLLSTHTVCASDSLNHFFQVYAHTRATEYIVAMCKVGKFVRGYNLAVW